MFVHITFTNRDIEDQETSRVTVGHYNAARECMTSSADRSAHFRLILGTKNSTFGLHLYDMQDVESFWVEEN